jgi:hypothetical protein
MLLLSMSIGDHPGLGPKDFLSASIPAAAVNERDPPPQPPARNTTEP